MNQKEISFRYNRKEGEELDKIIQESYDDFVRLERRNLLIASSALLLSGISGINPTSGSISGFSFNNLNERTYYLILGCIVLYFLFAFIIYAIPSFKRALKSRKEILKNSGLITHFDKKFSLKFPNLFHDARYHT